MQARQRAAIVLAPVAPGLGDVVAEGSNRRCAHARRRRPRCARRSHYAIGRDAWRHGSRLVTRVLRVRGPVAQVEGGRVREDVADMNPAAGNPRDSAGPVIPGATDPVAAQARATNVRTMALCVIAVILTLFALRTADAFFIPLLLSLFLNYA